MGVLDIIDTNRVELGQPGAQLAIKEVRHPACLVLSSYPFMSSGGSHITQYQEGSSTNKKTVSQGIKKAESPLIN